MSNQSLINDNNDNKRDEINNTFNTNDSNICENVHSRFLNIFNYFQNSI
jgi:hypothetical protein